MDASDYIKFVTVDAISNRIVALGPTHGVFKTYEEAEAAILTEIVKYSESESFVIRKQYKKEYKKPE